MNYRSIYDLNQTILRNLNKLPQGIDLVVGVPRSGLLAANIVALHLNLPLTDFEGLMQGRLIKSGKRCNHSHSNNTDIFKGKILIVDDSVVTGSTMQRIRAQIQEVNLRGQVIYSAIFVSPSARCYVDFYLEEIRGGRVFEWNLMHSYVATQSCFDIDGVLCEDPTEQQNDDGELYERFILAARPLRLPSVRLGYLVTCRLEKYRSLTVQWLQKHGVQYGRLFMMNLPSKEARRASGSHAAFKAQIYRTTQAFLFVESNLRQARDIARLANRPVLCTDTQQMIYPSSIIYAAEKLSRLPHYLERRWRSSATWLRRRLLNQDPPPP